MAKKKPRPTARQEAAAIASELAKLSERLAQLGKRIPTEGPPRVKPRIETKF